MTTPSASSATWGRLTAFFAPLALQTATQGMTHTIVAMVASRGEGGIVNFAGLSQAYKVMFFLGSMGAGLMTTGLVFGKSREEYRTFVRVCAAVIGSILGIHLLMNIPAAAHLLFGKIIGLPPAVEQPALVTFRAVIPLQVLFLMRTPFFSLLVVNRATGRAYFATLGRVILTVLMALVCVRLGLVGVGWAVVCMSIPVALELTGLIFLAVPFLRKLPPFRGPVLPAPREIAGFSFMFSFSKVLIALSDWILVAFIARAAQPERMLSAYSVVGALAAPVAFAATRIQAVYVSFAESADTRSRQVLRRFTVAAGLILGSIPLLLILPGIIHVYYGILQKVSATEMRLVVTASLGFFPFPLLVALRSAMEGRAAEMRRPATALTGNAVYVAFATITAFCALALDMPGNLIGQTGLVVGNAFAALTIYMLVGGRYMRAIRGSVDSLWFR